MYNGASRSKCEGLQQEVNAEVVKTLKELRESIRTPGPSEAATSRDPPTVFVEEPATNRPKAKHSLSHPDKYDGEKKAAYPAFKGHLRAKLRIDRAAIGEEPEQVWYGFGRLAGKAADRIFPWIDATEKRGIRLRVDDFFDQLDAAFYDAQAIRGGRLGVFGWDSEGVLEGGSKCGSQSTTRRPRGTNSLFGLRGLNSPHIG